MCWCGVDTRGLTGWFAMQGELRRMRDELAAKSKSGTELDVGALCCDGFVVGIFARHCAGVGWLVGRLG